MASLHRLSEVNALKVSSSQAVRDLSSGIKELIDNSIDANSTDIRR